MITYFGLILRIVLVIDLIFLSAADIKTRYIPVKGQTAAFLTGCVYLLLSIMTTVFPDVTAHSPNPEASAFFQEIESPGSLISGFIFITIICLTIAVTTGGLGGGDVKIFSAIGLSYGIRSGLEIMMITFLLSGIFCAVIKILSGINRRFSKLKNVKEIPLLPFITISSLLQFV